MFGIFTDFSSPFGNCAAVSPSAAPLEAEEKGKNSLGSDRSIASNEVQAGVRQVAREVFSGQIPKPTTSSISSSSSPSIFESTSRIPTAQSQSVQSANSKHLTQQALADAKYLEELKSKSEFTNCNQALADLQRVLEEFVPCTWWPAKVKDEVIPKAYNLARMIVADRGEQLDSPIRALVALLKAYTLCDRHMINFVFHPTRETMKEARKILQKKSVHFPCSLEEYKQNLEATAKSQAHTASAKQTSAHNMTLLEKRSGAIFQVSKYWHAAKYAFFREETSAGFENFIKLVQLIPELNECLFSRNLSGSNANALKDYELAKWISEIEIESLQGTCGWIIKEPRRIDDFMNNRGPLTANPYPFRN